MQLFFCIQCLSIEERSPAPICETAAARFDLALKYERGIPFTDFKRNCDVSFKKNVLQSIYKIISIPNKDLRVRDSVFHFFQLLIEVGLVYWNFDVRL